MIWSSLYKLTDTNLAELKNAGLDAGILSGLRAKISGQAVRRKAFDEMLDRIGNKNLMPNERKLILKYAHLSLLRLERFIPQRGIREWVDALIYAGVIALTVRFFIFAPFQIPSGSMYPTIKAGDHIFATKFSYGIPLPFTDIKLFRSDVNRGDIVIFPFPLGTDDYIKRVVARGGDTLHFKDGAVFINGALVSKEGTTVYCEGGMMEKWARNGFRPPCSNPLTIPKGHLFVMGDNRANSEDSRFWGFVKESTVIGRGWIIFFSHDPEKGIFSGYRLERFASVLK